MRNIFVATTLVIALGGCDAGNSYRVSVNSMSPTVNKGDVVEIDYDAYPVAAAIKRWDIVVITRKEDNSKPQMYVKRVVALPGETISYSASKVTLNGDPMEIPGDLSFLGTLASDSLAHPEATVEVPAGCVFVVGDNIHASRDSRHDGPVRFESIIGKVVAVNGQPTPRLP